MSSSASTGSGADPDDDADYDELLDDVDTAIAEARRKVESGRVRNAENERVRQGWIKVLAYTANVRRQIMNDKELTDLDARLSALEDGGGGK